MAAGEAGGAEAVRGLGSGGLALLGLVPGAPRCPHGERQGGSLTSRAWGGRGSRREVDTSHSVSVHPRFPGPPPGVVLTCSGSLTLTGKY